MCLCVCVGHLDGNLLILELVGAELQLLLLAAEVLLLLLALCNLLPLILNLIARER